MKKLLLSIMIIVLLLSPLVVYADSTIVYKPEEQKELDNIPKVGCKSVYIAEPTTGKVIYEKNAHVKKYPASTTKILTALLVMEKCELTDVAKVSKNAIDLVPEGYSNAKLQVGEELTISDLLHVLLIPSANEAANVLAEHVSGSVEEFAELCNNRAKELGCETLHFVNANGMHNEDHYCSAYDLYLIAKECQKHEIFNEIVKTTKFTLPATNKYSETDRTFTNTNYLILPSSTNYYYEYCTGIKTGTTTPAGDCLVASSFHDNINLICVVLDGGTNSKGLYERFYDTKQLFDFTYSNYSYKQVLNKENVITQIKVKDATKETAMLDIIVNEDVSTIVPNEFDINSINKTITLNDNISAPIEEKQVLGQVSFNVDGLNYTLDLVAKNSVEKLPYWLYNIIAAFIILIIFIIILRIVKNRKRIKKHRK